MKRLLSFTSLALACVASLAAAPVGQPAPAFTATDHGDFKSPAAMTQWKQAQKAAASAPLMDADGKIGNPRTSRTWRCRTSRYTSHH